MMNLFKDKINNHFNKQLPFVVYRKPYENTIFGIFQNTNELFLVNNFSEKGFVFYSFDGHRNVLIPANQSENLVFTNEFVDTISNKTVNVSIDNNSKTEFENLVANGVLAIQNNYFQKVVLSRKEIINLQKFDLFTVFSKLASQYQSAFRYCFYHPKVGLWFGATPEQLLQVKDNFFKTVALAGTQKFEGTTDVVWKDKEIQEQKFVTDFIIKSLEKLTSKVTVTEPFSVRAGNLIHLKSEVSGLLDSNVNLQKVLAILHPTPAVCGLPKDKTKKFILKNENYNREFYTGFVGELNLNNKSDLFVNLRCMQIKSKLAEIYVGCGITKDSIPEKEFIETVNKSMTMRNILDI